jgi:transposase-like protein
VKRFLLALIAVLAVSVPLASAELVHNYTYDGYYRWDSQANLFRYGDNRYFTRAWVTNPTTYYYSCGYQYAYAPSGYYKYTEVYPSAYTASAYVAPTYGNGWREQLLGIARQRDKYELENRRLAIDQAAYVESVKVLGLAGNFNVQGYGQGVNYPNAVYPAYGLAYGANANLGSYGNNGNNGSTVYGYSVAQVAQAYGVVDRQKLYAQAYKLGEGAQQAGTVATESFHRLVGEEGQNAARVLEALARSNESLAKGEAAERALKAAAPAASSTTSTTISGTAVGGSVPPLNTGGNGAAGVAEARTAVSSEDTKAFLTNVVTPNCAGCHTGKGDKLPGSFDIVGAWSRMTRQQKDVVRERIATRDPEKHMPRSQDGKPLDLSEADQAAFWTH